MKTQPQNKHHQLLTAVPIKTSKALDYLNFLLDVPFKPFKEIIHLVKHEQEDEYYIHVTDLYGIPANVLFNFVIATRAPIEFPDTLALWQRLKELGVQPGLAVCLAGLADLTRPFPKNLNATLVVEGPPSAGHWWFDMYSSWSNVINGAPNNSGLSYTKRPSESTPCNSIWHGVQDSHKTVRLFGKSLQELMEMF